MTIAQIDKFLNNKGKRKAMREDSNARASVKACLGIKLFTRNIERELMGAIDETFIQN